tara:strand:- start:604 stop:1017 length:414 start_codon:yes stop_codon:yes gene_type:complete
MKPLSKILRSTVAIAVAACCLDIVLSPQYSKAGEWKNSIVEFNDKRFQPWLRQYQIGIELGTPYYCKGMGSLPDDFDVMVEADKQFEKEFGSSPDNFPTPKLKGSTTSLIGAMLIFESMKRNCPEVDRIFWINGESN